MIDLYQEARDAAEDDGPDWRVKAGLLADRDVGYDVSFSKKIYENISKNKNIHNVNYLKKLDGFTNAFLEHKKWLIMTGFLI